MWQFLCVMTNVIEIHFEILNCDFSHSTTAVRLMLIDVIFLQPFLSEVVQIGADRWSQSCLWTRWHRFEPCVSKWTLCWHVWLCRLLGRCSFDLWSWRKSNSFKQVLHLVLKHFFSIINWSTENWLATIYWSNLKQRNHCFQLLTYEHVLIV